MDEQNLFGEMDTVYNTLHTHLTKLNNEITNEKNKIENAKEKILEIESERAEVLKSIKIVESKREEPIDNDDTKVIEPIPANKHEENSIDVELTEYLVKLMIENNPNSSIVKNLTLKRRGDWINSCRLMRERDGRTAEEIKAMIDFSQFDSFWKSNILSMAKLREKFDQLWLKAKKDNFNGIKGWLDEKRREENSDPF